MTLPVRAVALAAVFGLAATSALAQASPPPTADPRFEATTLDLSAYGEVEAPPDMATIDLGFTVQAATAAQALADNAQAMTKVVAALKAGAIEARDIQTANISLSPQYAYAPNEPPRLTGYEASNQATVTVRDLTRLGRAVDAVVNAGATNVGSIQFGLISRAPAENAARLLAVKALQDKASLYADASGYHIRRLVNLSEGVSEATPPRPVMALAQARAGAAPVTPVEAGELKVRVDVTGEFELSH